VSRAGGSSIVALAPHPDDEALGCGGTLALHADRGDSVTVVWMTAGERGIPDKELRDAAQIRRSEARASLAALGIEDGRFLDLPDGQIGAHHQPGADALARVLDECTPRVVFCPHRNEAHADHAATAAIAIDALRQHGDDDVSLLGYEVWSPVGWPHHSEDIDAVFERKLAAVECHRSQTVQVQYAQLVCGLSAYRGAMTLGCRHAESFVDIPWREDQ
jgi:LmbE family N-acetylglucosaminyl deacetylase